MIDPSISWAEKYRPKSIDDLIFPSNKWKKIVNEWISSGMIGGNIALFGPGGLGKSTLAQIIIKSIIKNSSDFKLIATRSVQEIDTIGDFVKSKPIGSPIRIVLIEEIDKMSSQAQNELKEKYTEKYQDNCAFIISTNYPNKIDEYLLQRFIYKIDFSHLDPAEVFLRLMFILKEENCKVNETELREWIDNNVSKGLRNLINSLQLASKLNDGVIVFDDISEMKDIEGKVIFLVQTILSNFMNCKDLKKRKVAFINPYSSEVIGPQWTEFIQTTTNNYGINYQTILEEVERSIHFIPLTNIIARYLEEVELKKYPHLHLISCVGEMMKCINETSC